ncbi:MAG: hypothetical protein ACK4L8_06730 [Nitrincola lacisaponensis]|uniref:hypothetical protein n=1 Tax=Nitrincola lacisaponensis TaxID=267850 RepID=UPI003919599B
MNNRSNTPFPKLMYYKHDILLGDVCVTCESVNPCCSFDGKIIDAKHEARKITWPYEPECNSLASRRLYLLADTVSQGDLLFAHVHIIRTGDDCQDDRENRISYLINDENASRYVTERLIKNQQVYTQTDPFLFSLAQGTRFATDKVTGWNTKPLLVMFAVGRTIFDLNRQLSGSNAVRVTPQMCVNHVPSTVAYEVIAIPQLKLEGGLRWGAKVTLNSTGTPFTREFEDTAWGRLEYGTQSITLQSTEKQSGQNKNQSSFGVLGLLERLINQVSTLHEREQQAKLDLLASGEGHGLNDTIGSRITISASVEIHSGVELKPQAATPNLELAITALSFEFKFGIIGTLDVIQAASQRLTPPVAAAIQKAREQAMSNNTPFNGYLKAELMFGCQSGVKAEVGACHHTLYADPPDDAPKGIEWGDALAVTGEIKFLAKAELGIHVGFEAWSVKAEAGVHGSLNTSWKIEIRYLPNIGLDDPQRCEYRYVFEGLIADIKAYVKMDIKDKSPSDSSGGGRTDTATDNTLEQHSTTLFDEVNKDIAKAQEAREKFDQPDVEIQQLTQGEARTAVNQMKSGFERIRLLDLLNRLYIGTYRQPDDDEIRQAYEDLLNEISFDYHHYRQREEFGLVELMRPSIGEWQSFALFGDANETET